MDNIDTITLLRLVGCKFDVKETERTYHSKNSAWKETTTTITITGPNGFSITGASSLNVVTDGDHATPFTKLCGDLSAATIEKINEMITNNQFKDHELIEPQNTERKKLYIYRTADKSLIYIVATGSRDDADKIICNNISETIAIDFIIDYCLPKGDVIITVNNKT